MPTPTKGPRLGGSPAHERLMLANLATALFEHGRIQTTETKAKRLRPLAERLITFAKRGDLHARRQVLTVVRDKSVVHTLFADIGPRYAERAGGYTRIVKVGPRKGDNAPMAVIELVEAVTAGQSVVGEAERSRGTRFARGRGGRGSAADSGGRPDAAATAPESSSEEVPPTSAAEVPAGEVSSTEGPAGDVPAGEGPAGEPAGAEPNVEQPGVREPNVAEPNVAEPNVAEPNVAEPNVAKPGVREPGGAGRGDEPAEPVSSVEASSDDGPAGGATALPGEDPERSG